ncbi:hypothetical protein AAFF_G00248550 [Aldrovandia affinis]|uniref:Secreted protein n=1 Tax=Aldrovandia affinis TaxID=143900 RepID=A0AAD7RDT6_9TELE|nr:hypothetical protein AAFF_G00248550 [Aldrovandia affinis]
MLVCLFPLKALFISPILSETRLTLHQTERAALETPGLRAPPGRDNRYPLSGNHGGLMTHAQSDHLVQRGRRGQGDSSAGTERSGSHATPNAHKQPDIKTSAGRCRGNTTRSSAVIQQRSRFQGTRVGKVL